MRLGEDISTPKCIPQSNDQSYINAMASAMPSISVPLEIISPQKNHQTRGDSFFIQSIHIISDLHLSLVGPVPDMGDPEANKDLVNNYLFRKLYHSTPKVLILSTALMCLGYGYSILFVVLQLKILYMSTTLYRAKVKFQFVTMKKVFHNSQLPNNVDTYLIHALQTAAVIGWKDDYQGDRTSNKIKTSKSKKK